MTVTKTTSPTSLHDMQQWMQTALIHPQAVKHEEAAARLKPSNRLSANQRLAIYQRSYITRLCACLAEQFPASRTALGEDLFDNFARVYLARDPSDSYTLYELGRRFPSFLEETRPDTETTDSEQEHWVNFMIDLAHYERKLFVLFDAPGHEGKDWPTPNTADEDLILQPCFTLGSYRFNVASYYHNATYQTETQLPPLSQSYVAITRYDYLTSTIPITYAHYEFLKSMQETHNIDRSLERLATLLNMPIDNIRESWTKEIRNRWINNHFFVNRDRL